MAGAQMLLQWPAILRHQFTQKRVGCENGNRTDAVCGDALVQPLANLLRELCALAPPAGQTFANLEDGRSLLPLLDDDAAEASEQFEIFLSADPTTIKTERWPMRTREICFPYTWLSWKRLWPPKAERRWLI